MTESEALQLFRDIGCMAPETAALRHIAYCHYIDAVNKGLTSPKPVAEAFAVLADADKRRKEQQQTKDLF